MPAHRRVLTLLAAAAIAAPTFAQPSTPPTPPAAPTPPTPPAAPAAPVTPAAPAAPAETPSAEKLPTPQEIQDKFITACGGREANEKIKARVISGEMEIAPMGIKGTVTVKVQAPAKARIISEIAGIGKIDQGSDGTHVWETNPMTGSRLLEGSERDEFLRSTSMTAELRLFETYPQSKTVGTDTVEGKPVYKVELTPKEGEPVMRFYEKESGLLVRQSQTVKNQMGDISADTFIGDYKDVGKVKLAHTTTTKVQGITQKMTFTKVETPDALPDDTFAPPEDVKQLIDAAKAEKKPEATTPKPNDDKPADPKK